MNLLHRAKVTSLRNERVVFDFMFHELVQPSWWEKYKNNKELIDIVANYYRVSSDIMNTSSRSISTTLSIPAISTSSLQRSIRERASEIIQIPNDLYERTPDSSIQSKILQDTKTYLAFLWKHRFILYPHFFQGECKNSSLRMIRERVNGKTEVIGIAFTIVFLKQTTTTIKDACTMLRDENDWRYVAYVGKDNSFYPIGITGLSVTSDRKPTKIKDDIITYLLFQGHFDELMKDLPIQDILVHYTVDVEKRYMELVQVRKERPTLSRKGHKNTFQQHLFPSSDQLPSQTSWKSEEFIKKVIMSVLGLMKGMAIYNHKKPRELQRLFVNMVKYVLGYDENLYTTKKSLQAHEKKVLKSYARWWKSSQVSKSKEDTIFLNTTESLIDMLMSPEEKKQVTRPNIRNESIFSSRY
jgi:hypothetical protein